MKKFHFFTQNRIGFFFCLWGVMLQLSQAQVWKHTNSKVTLAAGFPSLVAFSKPAPIPPPQPPNNLARNTLRTDLAGNKRPQTIPGATGTVTGMRIYAARVVINSNECIQFL